MESQLDNINNLKQFEDQVLRSKKPVFVDFWAEWCGPCRVVGPIMEDLAADYDGKVKFVKVNVDEANELVSKYNQLILKPSNTS